MYSETCPAEVMTSVDRAWLEMDDRHNPMVVNAILELEGVKDAHALVRTLVERLMRYPRFRQVADTHRDPPAWVPEASLSLGYHIKFVQLPTAGRDHALKTAIGREISSPLDRVLPLWRIIAFPQAQHGLTLLFRVQHAVADGIALVHMLLNSTDQACRLKKPLLLARHEHAIHEGPLGHLIDQMESVNSTLVNVSDILLDDLRHPAKLLQQIRTGRDTLTAVARVLRLPENNPPALRHALSGHRAVAWSTQLAFSPIRRLSKTRGVKINDVFVAALAGAFGRYLRGHGAAVSSEQNLRISIPVNLRQESDGAQGNRFGLVLLDLPVGILNWQQRLQMVSERCSALKSSSEARAVLLGLAAAGHMPVPIEKRLIQTLAGKAAAVVSNLPGPKRKLRFAKAQLANLVFWPPQAGPVGIGISLFSYAGHVTVGVSADTALIADPQRLMDDFHAEMESMLARRASKPSARRLRPAVAIQP